MDTEELMESIQEKIEDWRDRLADVDWRDPKVLGGVALAIILLGVGIYFLLAGSGTPPAKIQVMLQGKPVAGAYVYALLEDGTTKSFGPTNSEGYVQVPGDASIIGVKLPDGKMVRKTAFTAPGEISTLSLEGSFKKTVTFYVVGLSGKNATLYVFVEGNEVAQVQVTDGMATVDFGKDIVITPDNKITFKITADGYKPWELNTDGKHLQSIYDVTLVKKTGTDVPVGDLKIIVTTEGKPFRGRADLYDVTDTVAASAQITGGGAEIKGLSYGQYTLKIFDENGAYVTQKQITINSPENNVTIQVMTVDEAKKQGLIKEETDENGNTVILPATGENTSDYNTETGDGLTIHARNGVDFAIISKKPTVPVRIYVLDEDGAPVVNAAADINMGYTKAVETTDSTGKIEFGLHEGQCADVKITAPGYEDKNLHVCASDAETTVTLKHAYVTGDLQVTVQDYLGNPVNNAKVVIYHGGEIVGQPAYTDETGTAYIHKLITGNYVIRATKDGMSAEGNVSIEADQLATTTLTLYPGTATLKITLTENKTPVEGSVEFLRLDTGEKINTVNTGIDGKATVVVPAILPIRYVATIGDVKVKGPIMRLAPGDSKDIDINVPSFEMPDVKIIGIYDDKGREIANLPVGANFKIVAIVGSEMGGEITANTDDPDDVTLNVEGNAEAVPNGYTTVTITGHVSQYPLQNHASITISAEDASKTITLPMGNLMECTGDFCYSVTMYYDGEPITDDFKLIAGQKVHVKATLMYRGTETAHVSAEIRINKDGNSITLVGAGKDLWEPGEVETGEADFIAREGPYTEVLRLTTGQYVKEYPIKRFVAANKEKLKVVVVPETLLKTDKTQNIKIGVMKENSDVYFAPDGLTYTIYGVRYDGSVEQIRVLQNAASPVDVSISGIGSYTGIKVHAEAGIYAGDAEITLTDAAVKVSPATANLNDQKKWAAVRVSTMIDDDYTLLIHATATENTSCNIHFHVTPRDATLNAAEGKKSVELNVWYTGGNDCANAVGGDVKLTVSDDAGETIYETSIPIMASPKGSCLEVSTPGDEIEGKMEGEFAVKVKNKCTDPISVNVTVKGEGMGGTDLEEAGIFDPITLTTNGTEILSVGPGKSRVLNIHYKMSGGAQTVYSAKIQINASRDKGDEVDKEVIVYNTDVSNCLRIDLPNNGKITFGYSKDRGAYVADVPIKITIGRYCTIHPDTVNFEVEGDLQKHVTVASWQLKDLRIDLQNKLQSRKDIADPITEDTTIELDATDTVPLYEPVTGMIRMSAVAEPLAGPKANEEEEVNAETGVYTEPKKLSAEIEGTYYFEGSKIVSKDGTVKIYVGGKKLETEAFQKPLSGVSVTKAYAEVQGHDYDVNDGSILAQLNGSYVEINIPISATSIDNIASAGYKIHVAGTAKLADGNTINFEGILTSEVPVEDWMPGTPKDEEIDYEDDGHIACFHMIAPPYATKVQVSTKTAGAHIKECDNCKGLVVTKEGKGTITVSNNARVCVWVVKSATERSCGNSGSEQVTVTEQVAVRLTPVCNGKPVEKMSAEKTVEVTPYYSESGTLSADVDLNPFAADTYSTPEEKIVAAGTAGAAQDLVCKLGKYTNKLHSIVEVAMIIREMNEQPELFPKSVDFLVYNDGSCKNPDTPIKAACEKLNDAMNGKYFAKCTWTHQEDSTSTNITCTSLGDVEGEYKAAWKALGQFVKNNGGCTAVQSFVNKITMSSDSEQDSTVLEAVKNGLEKAGEIPIIVRSFTGSMSFLPRWYVAEINVPRGTVCTSQGSAIVVDVTHAQGISCKDCNRYLVAATTQEIENSIKCVLNGNKIDIPMAPQEIDVSKTNAYDSMVGYDKENKTVYIDAKTLAKQIPANNYKMKIECYKLRIYPDNKAWYLVLSEDQTTAILQNSAPGGVVCNAMTPEMLENIVNKVLANNSNYGVAYLKGVGHRFWPDSYSCHAIGGYIKCHGGKTVDVKANNILLLISGDPEYPYNSGEHCGKKEYLESKGKLPWTADLHNGNLVVEGIVANAGTQVTAQVDTWACKWVVVAIPVSIAKNSE